MNTLRLQELLNEHVLDPKNTHKMYRLAREYDILGQGAAAVSLYIRAADIEETDKLLQYKCMIGAALCYQRQGGRNHTVTGLLQHAISLLPDRPEAHYFFAKHGETIGDWRICLIHANMALLFNRVEDVGIEWPGNKELFYLQAHATWQISGTESGRRAFFDLIYRKESQKDSDGLVDQKFEEYIKDVLNRIGWPDAVQYRKMEMDRFKYPFKGIEKIEKNYSKHFQDMFVLACLDGKENGTYLEIGSGHPFTHNNTALLETVFGWKGISIEWSAHLAYHYAQTRKNIIINTNALDIDYEDLLVKHCMEQTIDFLQIDTDETSISVLRSMPFHRFKFNVVQFEHDAYRLDHRIRQEARQILIDNDYTLVTQNVCFRPDVEYEDWFVHNSMLSKIPSALISNSRDKNFFWDYFMRGK
jgi:hypothetical protein